MNVARQFYCLECAQMNEPCRTYGVIGTAGLAERRGVKEHECELDQTVPYGTGPFLDKSQAINCLATII